MAGLPASLNDRQKNSYRYAGAGEDSKQAVEIENTSPIPIEGEVTSTDTSLGLLSVIDGFIIDAVTITDPTTTTRAYAFRTGGESGSVVKTITVTYASANLKPTLDITKVVAT